MAKKIISWTVGNSVLEYYNTEANLQRMFNSYIKNYNLIFVPRKSVNVLVDSVSFYLEWFQRYDVLKNAQVFSGHPVYYALQLPNVIHMLPVVVDLYNYCDCVGSAHVRRRGTLRWFLWNWSQGWREQNVCRMWRRMSAERYAIRVIGK